FGAQAIGAGRRQPVDAGEAVRVQPHAIGNEDPAQLVIGAAAAAPVEQPAGDVGRIELARGFVLELVKAAFAAAVAQGLPFLAVERGERLLPEGAHRTQRSSSAATLAAPS